MVINGVNFESEKFIALCRTNNVKELYAFGSVLTADFDDQSDIDLLVEINEPDPIRRGKFLLSLYHEFESLFKKRVDLVTSSSIKNHFFEDYIGSRKKLIYPLS